MHERKPIRRNIDHIVVAVEDLELAGDSYRRLGFTLSPIMHQTTGLSNRLIMFQNTFIELMGGFDNLADNMGMLTNFKNLAERREGGIALSFLSNDAEKDYAALLEQNIQMTSPASFTRPVPLPDGTMGEVRASVSMSTYPQAPALNFFVCRQHRPQYVWIDEWQQHANTAENISCLTYKAREPNLNKSYVKAFVGADASADANGTLRYDTGRNEALQFMTPKELEGQYGGLSQNIETIDDDCLVGVRVKVASLKSASESIKSAGVDYVELGTKRFLVQPSETHGVFLEFTCQAENFR